MNCVGVLLMLLMGPVGFSTEAQSPPQAPIARAAAHEVLLDLVVHDKRQRLVNDLRSNEVEVYEDGARREVKSFRFVSSPASDGTSSARTLTNQLPDPNRQINLVSLVFDRLNADARRMARQAMADLLARPLPRNTWYAVIVLDYELRAIQEFTDDKDAIDRAVKRATDGGYAQYVNDSERVLGRLEEEGVKEFVMPSDPTRPVGIMRRMIKSMLSKESGDLRAIEGRRQGFGVLKLAQAQTGLQGRKTVIYFCEGLTKDQNPTMLDIVSAANRNNVTFYPIDLRGLKSPPIVDPGGGLGSESTIHGNLISTQMAMDELAKGTGGFAVENTNDVRVPLERVMDQVASHYELSYIPESTNLDGHFRKIEVRLLRPGLKVQTRSGYFAVPMAPGEVMKPFEMTLLTALQTRPLPEGLPFRSAVFRFPSGSATTTCAIVFDVPLDKMRATVTNDSKALRFDASFLALVRNTQDQVVKKIDADESYELKDANPDLLRTATLTASRKFELEPGSYIIETAALDRETLSVGTKRAVLSVPAHQPVNLSDVVLVRRMEPLQATQVDVDPLQFRQERIMPSLSGDLTGSPDTEARLFFVIYPAARETGPLQLDIELASDGKILFHRTSELAASNGPLPYLALVPTKSLATGDYEAVITVHQGNATAQGRTLVKCP